MSDKIILNAFQKTEDADVDKWLLAPGADAPVAQFQPATPTAPAPAQHGGGFFNAVGGWVRKQTGATDPNATGPLAAAGRAFASVPERISEGLTQMREAREGEFQPLDVELPGVGKVTVPAGIMRAAHGATGALKTVFPLHVTKPKPTPREK